MLRSKVRWEGVDWSECLKYLAINLKEYKARQLNVHNLIPVRKFKKGPKPGITSVNAMGPDRETEDRWVPVLGGSELTEEEKARVMGACVEVAIVFLFLTHKYKFCDHLYLQQGFRTNRSQLQWILC